MKQEDALLVPRMMPELLCSAPTFKAWTSCGSEQAVSGPRTEDGATLAQSWPVSGVEVSPLRVWNQES